MNILNTQALSACCSVIPRVSERSLSQGCYRSVLHLHLIFLSMKERPNRKMAFYLYGYLFHQERKSVPKESQWSFHNLLTQLDPYIHFQINVKRERYCHILFKSTAEKIGIQKKIGSDCNAYCVGRAVTTRKIPSFIIQHTSYGTCYVPSMARQKTYKNE